MRSNEIEYRKKVEYIEALESAKSHQERFANRYWYIKLRQYEDERGKRRSKGKLVSEKINRFIVD